MIALGQAGRQAAPEPSFTTGGGTSLIFVERGFLKTVVVIVVIVYRSTVKGEYRNTDSQTRHQCFFIRVNLRCVCTSWTHGFPSLSLIVAACLILGSLVLATLYQPFGLCFWGWRCVLVGGALSKSGAVHLVHNIRSQFRGE